MRRVSMATRTELVGVLTERYGSADRAERGRILDEFVAVTGFHRKRAMRLLRAGPPRRSEGARPQRRIYDDAVPQALVMVWEAVDRICGKRLKALLPTLLEAMDRHGHLALEPAVRKRQLTMSAATIDRALIEQRAVAGRKRRRLEPSSARASTRTTSPTSRSSSQSLPSKLTLRRPCPQGSAGETDTFGAQQHAPLLGLVVLLSSRQIGLSCGRGFRQRESPFLDATRWLIDAHWKSNRGMLPTSDCLRRHRFPSCQRGRFKTSRGD